jgi:hypothetical protein
MDDLTKEEREYNLRRIAEQDRKRKEKIENFESISPELAKKLNERKSRAKRFSEWLKYIGESKPIEPEATKLSDAEILKRNALTKLLKEDNPEPELGVNLWEDKKKKNS